MGIVVQKFGGTSVGCAGRIRSVAKLIRTEQKLGNKVVVVVSAMAGVTDNLAKLAQDVIGDRLNLSNREYDVVLSSGEVASAGLLALALENLGIKCRSFQAWQIKINTNARFNDARIIDIETDKLNKCIDDGIIPIVCGFQGVSGDFVTTLGRGGSDTTAIAIAAALKAEACDIYTDVDGIYSIDPNRFAGAKKIESMGYDEVINMAYSGAKVLHPRAAEIGKRYGVEIRVRSSFNPLSLGTLIKNYEAKMEQSAVTAVTAKPNQALVSLLSGNDFIEVLKGLSAVNYNVENSSIQGAYSEILISVSNEDVPLLERILGKKIANIEGNLAKITVTGLGIKHSNQTVEKVFQIIQNQGIKILQSAITDISINLYVADKESKLAQDLHDALII
jgi:aspartate kinase